MYECKLRFWALAYLIFAPKLFLCEFEWLSHKQASKRPDFCVGELSRRNYKSASIIKLRTLTLSKLSAY